MTVTDSRWAPSAAVGACVCGDAHGPGVRTHGSCGAGAGAESFVGEHLDRIYQGAEALAGEGPGAERLVLATLDTALAAARWPEPSARRRWLYRLLLGCYAAHVSAPRPAAAQSGDPATREPRAPIRAALQQLPPSGRFALFLSDVEGFDYDDIARTMDLPRSQVADLLGQSRTRLASGLRVHIHAADSS